MKKLIMIVLLGSFVFSGVNFNKGVAYGDLDGAVTVTGTMGINFDLNDSMSLGWDTGRGMTVDAAGPAGVGIRIGYGTASSIGVGYNWWSGGDAIKTTIGTSLDYSTSGGGNDATSVSLNLGWGF